MIYYFSATGNGKRVAEIIADITNDKVMSITDVLAANCMRQDLLTEKQVGIISPTYAWGLPSIVNEFLENIQLKLNEDTYMFFVATYGTTPGTTGHLANKILRQKNNRSFNAFYSVKMPDTWTPVFDLSDQDVVNRKNEAAEKEMKEVAKRILSKETPRRMKLAMPVAAVPIYKIYYNQMRKTKNFHVDDSCIGCTLCEKKCPVKAIEMKDSKPVWVKEKCTMCLGCLHRCPKFAIQYGKGGATKRHGQYKNPYTKI
ncbi:ferredoxin [Lachnospiraceae bacterium KM106-2]|nr:ferredoxin [Lachnospiraceae bacterium KM106-2]